MCAWWWYFMFFCQGNEHQSCTYNSSWSHSFGKLVYWSAKYGIWNDNLTKWKIYITFVQKILCVYYASFQKWQLCICFHQCQCQLVQTEFETFLAFVWNRKVELNTLVSAVHSYCYYCIIQQGIRQVSYLWFASFWKLF